MTTPQIFENIIGHEETLRLLHSLLSGNSIPHALLFSGPQAVGKRTVARACASALLTAPFCEDNQQFKQQQQFIAVGTHPDLYLISVQPEKKDIAVEEIRELRTKLQLKPYYGVSRVAVIDEAHRMSAAAMNALLKTLEEPAPGTYLILVSHSGHRLLPTIVSRCQTFHFSELPESRLLALLQKLLQTSSLPQEALTQLAHFAKDSLFLLDIERFIDPLTLAVNDHAGFEEHCSEVLAQLKALESKFARLLAPASSLSRAVSLATELGSVKDSPHFAWNVLRNVCRRNVCNTTARNDPRWGDLLLETLESERLVFERNANPHLQFTSLLVKMWGLGSGEESRAHG